MTIKTRFLACLMAALLCMSLLSTTALAYSEDTEAAMESTVPAEESTEAKENSEDTAEPVRISLEELMAMLQPKEEASEEKQIGVVTVSKSSYLNVRTGAGMEYEIIDHLNTGEKVEVMEQHGDWYKVMIPEQVGYVHKDYLDVYTEKSEKEDVSLNLDTEILKTLLEMFTTGLAGEIESDSPALTPDGNLNLIDDIGKEQCGKQFITVTTKNGNYFYLLIDRDDEGEQTVHFLNQVDEADLLSLMDEDAAAEYLENQKPEPTEPVVTEPPVTQEPTEEPEPEPEKKGNPWPALILLLALIGGGGGYFYFQMQKKKQTEQEKPDPDADYSDEEDFDLPDDAEYVDTEDEYIDDMPV